MHSFIRRTGVILLATMVAIGAYLVPGVVTVEASPAYPVVKSFTQPDGTTVELRLWGDEFVHGWETLDGYTVVRNAKTGFWEYAIRNSVGELVPSGVVVGRGSPPAAPRLRPALDAINAAREARGAPPVGVPRLEAAPPWAGSDTDVLFIMVEFTDVACTFSDADMQTNLFGGGASGPGDLDDYFREISYGNLELDGLVEGGASGCYALANNHTHYDQGPGSARSLVQEAIGLADPDVDFSVYDNDGDGFVDALGIIYAGGGPHDGCETDDPPPNGGGDNLWPHSWHLASAVTVDGVQVYNYIIQPEITYGVADGVCDEMQTAGLFAHEFGHALGLPDLYDTDGSSSGVGWWSTMASQFRSTVNLADTPPHYDPWSKWWLGWITPVDYTGFTGDGAISQVETTGFVVRLLDNPGGPEQGGSGEYFLVENRQQVNFDSQVPGCGLLIWHIEESQTTNEHEGHTTASHRLVDLEEADGLDHLDAGTNRGDTGDPYPGSSNNRLFDDASYPTANLYDGSPSGVRIADISDCGAVMSANFGNPSADVAIVKVDNPDPVLAGEQLFYEITVTNNGPAFATNVEVTDILPSGVSYATDTDSCVESPAGTLTCSLGDMLAGETQGFTILVEVDSDLVASAGGPTAILNTASVTADQADDDLTNNTATASTIVNEEADLRVAKDCKPDDPMLVGEWATCTIVVENLGPSTARNATAVDEYVSDGTFEFGSVTTTAGTCSATPNPQTGGGTVTCDLGDMAPGDTVTIEVPVTADEPQNINDLVTVSSTTPDPNPANNVAEDEINVTEMADLEVFKECKPDQPVPAGEEATCTITVKNWGPSTAANVTLEDVHLSDGTFDFGTVTTTAGSCSISAGTVTCTLGDLAPGAEATVVVPLSATEGMDINDTATASSDTYDLDNSNNSASDGVTVMPVADLALTKTAAPDPVVIAGTQLTYDLGVTNNGPSTAVNVVIEDVLPAGVTIDSVSSSAGTCNAGVPGDGALPTTCTFDTLAPSASATMQIVVTVEPQTLGVLGNNAQVHSDVYDPDNSNNLATTATTVEASADLAVSKADSPDPVLAGEMLTYDVTISNNGPSTAVDVMLTDTLPDEVSFVGYTVSNGSGTCVLLEGPPNAVECDLNDLDPGQFVTVFIDVMVDPAVPDGTTITNMATVSSVTPDPDDSNNTDTEDTLVLAEADLAITKDANFLTANPSGSIVYALVVMNTGPSDAQGVVVVDELPLTPKKIVYVMDSGNGACAYDDGTHDVTCNFGTLAAGESVSVDIIVDARGSVRRITNVATVSSSTTDPDPSNNTASKEIRIKGGPGKGSGKAP